MILDELVLHHFGVYGPRQVVELAPPSPDRPVVLFGGLNGGGKTTLLDAVQLCLFGPQARCSNRGGLAYHDYLLRSIHRRAAVEEAAVELAFRHTVDGVEGRFRLHRSWRRAAGGCRERFEVVRDGRLDRALTENWAQQVDDLFPARIAHLFLFDGEKVEAYAAPESSSALVGAAIHDLLGLDVVDRLDRDLRVLERRKRAEAGSSDAAPATAESERELRDLRQRLDQLKQEQAGVRGRIERKRRALADAEERFRGLGGELLERREALERRRDEADAAVGGAERRLRELAAGPLPFLLVPDLLEAVRARDGAERETLQARAVADALEARDRALLDELPGLGAGRAVGDAVGAFLADDLRRRREAAGQPVHLDLSAEGRHGLATLLGSGLAAAAEAARGGLADLDAALRHAGHARLEAASVPDPETVAPAARERLEAREELARLLAEHDALAGEIERLARDVERKGQRLEELLEAAAEAAVADDDRGRVLRHSARVRGTLSRFRLAVVERHVRRIEALVLESYRRLLRKRRLVSGLAIDPGSFALTLYGHDGSPLSPERLSAGERQLLATALLWGLARALGRALPTAIDTPLGRLDGDHRALLVERYFPHASHQVLLLSTDEEIAGGRLERLRPHVGRCYHVVFDEAAGCSRIEPGYFGRREAA